jgi:hypothetical protein
MIVERRATVGAWGAWITEKPFIVDILLVRPVKMRRGRR